MVTLVDATTEDEAFLYEVYRSTRHEEVTAWGWGDEERDGFLRMQFDLQQRSYRLQYPWAQYSILYKQGVRIGRIILNESPQEIRLIDISLLPEYRNAGIGTAFLKELQKRAETHGKPVRLQVIRSNPAVSLYERLGFYPVENQEPYAVMEWRGNQHE